jgi:hypothetical protein
MPILLFIILSLITMTCCVINLFTYLYCCRCKHRLKFKIYYNSILLYKYNLIYGARYLLYLLRLLAHIWVSYLGSYIAIRGNSFIIKHSLFCQVLTFLFYFTKYFVLCFSQTVFFSPFYLIGESINHYQLFIFKWQPI